MSSRMSRRERLDAILRGVVPDRPAVKLWGAQPGQKLIHPAFQKVLDAALARTDLLIESPRYLDWSDLYWGAEPPRITVERRPTDSPEWLDEITTVQTPGGPLRNVRRISTVGRSGYFTERYIKEPSDLEKFLSVRYVLPRFDAMPFLTLDRSVGDGGRAVFLMAHAPAALVLLIGSENFALWLADCREQMLHVLGILSQRLQQHLRSVLDAGVRGVFGWGGPELLIPPLVSPATFDQFDTPFDRPVIEMIHNAGSRVWVHCHGQMKVMLRRFMDMGVDVLHPIEPPPSGDITLAEAFTVVGDCIGLDGNIQVHDFFTLEPKQIRALVHEALAAGKGRRFILCPTSYYMEDPYPTDRYIGNWLAYIDEACACAESMR